MPEYTLTEYAQAYLDEELHIIPVQKNKRPTLPKKSKYFEEKMPESEINEWFKNAYGIGIRCGGYSSGIECLDFDDHDGKQDIKSIFNKFSRNEFVASLWQAGKAYIQQTPSGGYHFVYRYENESEEYEGNQKLARWEDKEVMIETRGHGGYFITYPTPKYNPLYGDLAEIASIDHWERDMLLQIAASMTRYEESEDGEKTWRIEKTDPISTFNAEKIAYAKKLLEDIGWQKAYEDKGIEYWTRPGKKTSDGVSATFGHMTGHFYVFSSNTKNFQQGVYYSAFQIFVKLRYKGNYHDAIQHLIDEKTDKSQIPYIRVGIDYFKIVDHTDVWGIHRKQLKRWSKDEIKEDHGKNYLKEIPRYDDFALFFDYKNHRKVVNNCYNLAAYMDWTPEKGNIKWSKIIMKHIFGDQLELGYRYMKMLYEHPHHIAPILALVSKERETGKTTVIQWLTMIFGQNAIIIGNQDITSNFNSTYADKNLIVIEETLLNDQKSLSIEKLKSLSTAKQITVNKKFVSQYTLPFYGKLIITSNNEDRFVRIDEEETRFFVRKMRKPEFENHNILEDLKKEIPAFLYYLENDISKVDFSKSRTGFTSEELQNEAQKAVKKESKTELYKDLEELITDWFYNNSPDDLFVNPRDIKEKWFHNNSRISLTYIRNVIKKEFNIKPVENQRYSPFANPGDSKTGTPFIFKREWFIGEENYEQLKDEIPF